MKPLLLPYPVIICLLTLLTAEDLSAQTGALPAENLNLTSLSDRDESELRQQKNRQDFDLDHRIARITLFHPLGTNGINAHQYSARYSLNLLAGYHGGLDRGYEIGPVNINRYYTNARLQLGMINLSGGRHTGFAIGALGTGAMGSMQGVHLSGLGMLSGQSMEGVQISGIFQTAKTDITGIQMAGISNVAGANMEGIQMAGVANLAKGNIMGIQASGVINFGGGEVQGIVGAGVANIGIQSTQGILASGVANISGGSSQGILLAGTANISGGSSQGIFIAGAANITRNSTQGIYVSGATNITAENSEGVFISGAANVNRNSMSGLQVAGAFNYSKTAQGVQVAPFNLAREFQGLPVGLISWYGNGRKQVDFWGSETGFLFTGLKTGTQHYYNLAGIGYNPYLSGREVYALSWTIGYYRSLNEAWELDNFDRFALKRDVSIQHLQEDGKWFTSEASWLYQYRHLFAWEAGPLFTIYGGPTFNMLVSRSQNIGDYYPYSIIDTSSGTLEYRFWIGGSFGVQFF